MIERYVFLKLSSEMSNPESRRELSEKARGVFPTMDGVENFKAAIQSDASGASPWDLAMTIRFASAEAVERYMQCPIHAEFDGELAMILEDIASWSFELA